ncbi:MULTISPECIES: anthranilate synthase component I family protein [Chitinophaga]|uniref:anthranilate synthase component I family protein n=1 Tax=Chitinophaga TaxID=79328 RepID=UPI001CEC0E7C|nr:MULTISPECIES: anthranilate synthase component I family protein [Chitinophaga]
MDNNDYPSPYHRYEAILATESLSSLQMPAGKALPALQQYFNTTGDWLFGHLAYDLKNETQPGLTSSHPDSIGFPDLYFFQPATIILLEAGQVHIGIHDPKPSAAAAIYNACLQCHTTPPPITAGNTHAPAPAAHLNRTQYLHAVQQLQHHIHLGDCYEVNFCRENFITNYTADPLALFRQLNALSPAPFAAYYRTGDRYLICSSPERFLQHTGDNVISQPIKGTSRRHKDPQADKDAARQLHDSGKERAENIMIVDLVRNDLSHTAQKGSVHVTELCGIHSFAQVHHMVSTVAATPRPGTAVTDLLATTFPMGSMTGAPKIRVLQLIEQYEKSRRGLYSGALGYITPDGRFDFNVVIRSILYNAANQYLSYQTGSAITFYSDPEKEWEECLLKAEAMHQVISRLTH